MNFRGRRGAGAGGHTDRSLRRSARGPGTLARRGSGHGEQTRVPGLRMENWAVADGVRTAGLKELVNWAVYRSSNCI